MSDRLGLMLAIHEQPNDDLPRLAYADWLEEQGEVEHAEFIRVELQLARMSKKDESYRALFQRELELIRAHKDEWFGTFRSNWSNYDMRRGFIDEVSAGSAEAVLPHADWLLSHHALQDLRVGGNWTELVPLLNHPITGVLARLMLNAQSTYGGYWSSSQLFRRDVPLASRPLLLSLEGHSAGPELIEHLLDSPHIGRVTWLNLSLNALGAIGVRQLLDGLSSMPQLKTLLLAGQVGGTPQNPTLTPNIGRDGFIVLADHPAIATLEHLDLSGNRIDANSVRALIDSPYLGGICKLVIGQGPSRIECRRLRQHFGSRVDLPSET